MIRLKELRKECGISQSRFAQRFGVAQNTVSNWENEVRAVDSRTISIMADFFDVSIDYLMGKSDIRRSDTNTSVASDNYTDTLQEHTKYLTDENKKQLLNMAIFLRKQQEDN